MFSACSIADNRIELTGVGGQARENIQIYLSSFAPAQINKSARFKNRVAREIRQALRSLGYYQVLIDFEDQQDGNDYILLANITQNKYVYYQLLDLQIHGDAVRDADFIRLSEKLAPRKGDRMHHGEYDAYKQALLELAHRKGYFDAEFKRAELQVTPGKRQGRLYLYFYSGVRYRFGDIQFTGSQISEDRLASLLPFQSGSPYSTELLAKFNQRLAQTQWFSSIDLQVDPDNRHDGVIPVTVAVTPAVRHIVEAGVGYATDVAARLRLNWERPWLNARGHSISSKLALSQKEQSVEAAYKFPLKDVQNDFYKLSVAFAHQDLTQTATVSRSFNLKAERQWLWQQDWYAGMTLRWLYEDYQQASQQDQANLLLPGIFLNHNSDSGGSMPTDADALKLNLEIANQALASDTDFIRFTVKAGRIGSFSPDRRWLLKAEGGIILQEAYSSIPPSLRFFAGGDSNLRGYGYRTVAPVDSDNNLLGGTRLAVVSAEYQQRMSGNWWLAAFTDYGSAWNDRVDFRQSIGLGVRWASPVGPIRFDLAYGLDHEPNGKFRLHFTLGPEL